jgi:hypothetical protein
MLTGVFAELCQDWLRHWLRGCWPFDDGAA